MHGLRTGRRLALASALLAAAAFVGGTPAHAQRPAAPAPAAPRTARVGASGLAVTRACRGRHTIAYFRKHHCAGYR